MIKINLVREGRAAVRGASSAPSSGGGGGAVNYNGLLLVSLLVAGLLAGAGYYLLKQQALSDKQSEVALRRDEAKKLEGIIKEVEDYQRRKDSLEKRIALINDLKRNQKNPVKIMDRISQNLPDLVWLDTMSLDGRQLKITGRALNPNAVSNFIANLKADPLFEEPGFNALSQAGAGVNVYSYEMTLMLRPPPAPVEPAAGSTTPGEGGATSATSTGA